MVDYSGCPLCGSQSNAAVPWATTMVRSAFEAQIVRCLHCGLAHIDRVPATVDGIYEDDYFQAYHDAGMVFPTEAALHRRFRDRLRTVEFIHRRGCLLEIGVGHGEFLAYAAGQGWQVTGVDVSQYVASRVKERHGIEIICGPIESVPLPERAYDMIHLSHVLEHLPNPLGTLRRLARLLTPGGVMAIEVPNELENFNVIFRRHTGMLRPYPVRCTHVTFFTAATLGQMIRAAGFDVVAFRTLRDESDPVARRRAIKWVGGHFEAAFGRGPLIEMFATVHVPNRSR